MNGKFLLVEDDMTEGQWRVGVEFNPSKDPDIDRIKQKTADVIHWP